MQLTAAVMAVVMRVCGSELPVSVPNVPAMMPDAMLLMVINGFQV